MCEQTRFVRELLRAVRTLDAFLRTGVIPQVVLEDPLSGESFVAQMTCERVDLEMDVQMSLLSVFSRETFATYFTREWCQ